MKPCPFCGSTDLDVPSEGDHHRKSPHCYLMVRCLTCGAEGPHSELRQTRLDGQPYVHTAVEPQGEKNQKRWRAEALRATRAALTGWNARA